MPSYAELREVNAKYNALPYVSEFFEDWTPITAAGGDCDSYATAKMEELLERGWPRESLRLATCYVETGGYHAVLLVDLEGQTWVLDNRQSYPAEFQLLPYRWDKIQVPGTLEWRKASF